MLINQHVSEGQYYLQIMLSEINDIYLFSDNVDSEGSASHLPLLFWPFLLIGIWEFIVSVGFLAQGKQQQVHVFFPNARFPTINFPTVDFPKLVQISIFKSV